MGGEQLYLGLASFAGAAAGRAYQARGSNRQGEYPKKFPWLFWNHGGHLCAVVCQYPPMEAVYESSVGLCGVDKLFDLVLLLVGFYVLYAVQNVFDSTFYGLGKTNYMLFESVVTNTVYYGIAFVLYATGLWTPTLTGIALLFGIGNAFDSLVSAAAYAHLLKKQKINILRVE